jgi:hypothetical protein
MARHGETMKTHRAAVAAAKVEMAAAMATIFSTTANFFRGDGKTPWDNIIHKQTEKDPWTNLRGEEQSGVRGKTMAAWQDCYTLMLKTVFTNNTAEQQKYYLTLLRLNPAKMKVRPFLQRFTTLAGYVGELPSLIHSRDAMDVTKPVEPHGYGELATIGLHAMPGAWQKHYDLVHKAPRDVQYLQDALEKIELAFLLWWGNGSSKNNRKGNKMTTMTDNISKKKSHAAKHERPSAKYCALCRKHWDAHKTHNMGDCKKYDHQGNLKKGFTGKGDTPPGTNKSYAQLFAETEKLKASRKKLKKALEKC